MSPLFQGVYTALVTPFRRDGSVDNEAYRALIEQQIAGGIDGVVVCGTTGEAATLTAKERSDLIALTVRTVDGRVPVLAGCGSNDTRVAIEAQREAKAHGVDGALQVTPWYNKPTQEGLFQHFRTIVEEVPLPTMLYNVPGRTSVDLLPQTVARLARACSDIVSLKEATGSIARAQDVLAKVSFRDDFSVLSGEDALILGLLSVGGHGVVSVISHICVEDLRNMVDAYRARETGNATASSKKVFPLVDLMFFRANPIPVKAALAMTRMRGVMTDKVRLPLVPLDDDDKATLRRGLIEAGYLHDEKRS